MQASGQKAIQVTDLPVAYQDKPVLLGIDLDVPLRGEISGSKTALYARKGVHTTVLNFFNSQKESDPRQLGQVKSWVSQAFNLSEDVSVMITQLQCTEEGCPPVETVIAIMETPGKPQQYKIHKPLAEVKQTDIVSLTAG